MWRRYYGISEIVCKGKSLIRPVQQTVHMGERCGQRQSPWEHGVLRIIEKNRREKKLVNLYCVQTRALEMKKKKS